MPWLVAPSLEASVELSVRKLALDRRRNSLRNVGAMVVHGSERRASLGQEWSVTVPVWLFHCQLSCLSLSMRLVIHGRGSRGGDGLWRVGPSVRVRAGGTIDSSGPRNGWDSSGRSNERVLSSVQSAMAAMERVVGC